MDLHILGSHSVDEFISEYWQQKPLLIRQAIEGFQTPLTAEILAGLSLEEGIRSRLVIEHVEDPVWECRFGPLTEDDFDRLPESKWTLLVQDVEKHLPEHASLLDHFGFLPRWRIEDLMVSYAVDGGSVGPHTDNYDVFLLQASGQRHWQIQTDSIASDELLDDIELKILRHFEPDHEWTLNPGDMLYLPSGIAHHGIAAGECMTFSIGFRAPTRLELLQYFTDQLASSNVQSMYYTDPPDSLTGRRGELDSASLQRFQELLRQSLDDSSLLNRAIGGLLTDPTDTPAMFDHDELTLDEFISQLTGASSIKVHPAVRSLYMRQQQSIRYFINSEGYEASPPAADVIMQLIDNYRLSSTLIATLLADRQAVNALYRLYLDGGLHFEH
jgi:50S ribosomal protein L16 3-hydroxylase